jgi:hypothetical protein
MLSSTLETMVKSTGRKVGSGLTPDQAKHLAEVLRSHLPRFENNISTMARAWRVSQPQLSQLLMASGGAGVAVLCRIRAAIGMTIDDLLGLPPIGNSLSQMIRSEVREALVEMSAPHEVHLLPPSPPKKRSRRDA